VPGAHRGDPGGRQGRIRGSREGAAEVLRHLSGAGGVRVGGGGWVYGGHVIALDSLAVIKERIFGPGVRRDIGVL
jgi:hypothetical protein